MLVWDPREGVPIVRCQRQRTVHFKPFRRAAQEFFLVDAGPQPTIFLCVRSFFRVPHVVHVALGPFLATGVRNPRPSGRARLSAR